MSERKKTELTIRLPSGVQQGFGVAMTSASCNSQFLASLRILVLCTVRLSVRTLPFQGRTTSSILVRCAKIFKESPLWTVTSVVRLCGHSSVGRAADF